MSREPSSATREQRLAAKLRENLQRRKAQSRELAAQPTGSPSGAASNPRSSQDDAE